MSKLDELRGVGKILDSLWDNSYYGLGKDAAKRIKEEMIYYFGENWSTDMYAIIDDGNTPHTQKPIKRLSEFKATDVQLSGGVRANHRAKSELARGEGSNK